MKTTYTLLPLLALSSFAAANDNIERITVSGDFRQTQLSQLSSSASILDAARINARQSDALDELLGLAPNVNFNAGASRGRFVQIRGIGERSQYAEPLNPSVSFIVDDFDFSGLGAAGVLFDVQQVEVFRGPQSTLFGTGALAGAINVVSTPVDGDTNARVALRLGSQNSRKLEAAGGTQLGEGVAVRVAAMHNQSDGFVSNTYLNRDDTNNIDESAARVGLAFDLGTSTRLEVNYRWYDIDNGYDAFSLDNDGKTRSDEPGFDRQQTDAVSIKTVTDTQFGEVKAVVTKAQHDIAYGYDEDWTFVGFHPWEYSSFDAYYRDITTETAELRFTGGDAVRLFNGTTDWLVGIRYRANDEDIRREYTYLDSPFGSDYQPTTVAVYGQFDAALSSQLNLQFGWRAENYDFDYRDSDGLMTGTDKNMLGGKLSLSYVQGRNFYYASVSRGFKGPGLNPDQKVPAQQRFYDAEYNWNYELGYKGQLAEGVSLRAAIFRMERKNTQVSDYAVFYRADNTPEFVDIISNADIGVNQGLEAELDWQVSSDWQVALSMGYLDATFSDYTRVNGEFVGEREQAQAPRFTANVFSSLVITDHITWQLGADVKDDYYFSDGHDERAPFTVLVNTQLEWQNNNWTVSLYANNLFDRLHYTRGFGGFSNDPRDEYAFAEPYFQLGDGREYGISMSYDF